MLKYNHWIGVLTMTRKRTLSILASLLFATGLFVAGSYYTQQYLPQITAWIGTRPVFGLGIYLLLTFLAIVFAPFSALPFLPVVANVWGALTAAAITVVGWLAGAVLAFWLAQRYGQPVIVRLVSLEKVRQLEEIMPQKNIFWTIVLLRLSVPVDFLSYALGLFTRIRVRTFFLASFLGMLPGALLLAYLGTIPISFQIIFLVVILLIFFAFVRYMKPKWWRVLTK